MKLGVRILDLGFSKKTKKQNKNSVSSVAPCENKKYEAFGNLIWEEGAFDDNREFTGKEKEPTGFHYFGARRYYANIGRFNSPDPHTVMPGNIDLSNPQELNPYVYCYNDPLALVDPDGLSAMAAARQVLYTNYEVLLPNVGGCHCEPGGLPFDLGTKIISDDVAGFSFSRACQIHDAAYATEGISKALADVTFLKAMTEAVFSQASQEGNSLDFTKGLEGARKYYDAVSSWSITSGKLGAGRAYNVSQKSTLYKWTDGGLERINTLEGIDWNKLLNGGRNNQVDYLDLLEEEYDDLDVLYYGPPSGAAGGP